MLKKILVFLLIGFVSISFVFAAEGTEGTNGNGSKDLEGDLKNPFANIFRMFVTVVLSATVGVFVASRFFMDLGSAYFNSDEHPGAVKQAVIKFLIVIIIVTSFSVVLIYLTSGAEGSNDSGDLDYSKYITEMITPY